MATHVASHGQCSNFNWNIIADVTAGGPSNISWQIRNDQNEIVFSGTVQPTIGITLYSGQVCLETGCYTFRVIGNALSADGVFEAYIQNENEELLAATNTLTFGSQIFNFGFCTNVIATICNADFEYTFFQTAAASFFHLNSSSEPNLLYEWSIDEVPVSNAEQFEYYFNQNGEFNVCLEVVHVVDGITTCVANHCENITIVDWFNPLCPDSMIYSGLCGNQYFDLLVGDYETFQWTIDNTVLSQTTSHLELNGLSSGEHIVCAEVQTEGCPEGAEICAEINVNDCTYENCFIELNAVDLGNGTYEFTAYGLPEVYPMLWNFGDGNTLGATWVVIHQFESPGEYTVCGGVSSEQCFGQVQGCVSVSVNEVQECTTVNFGVNALVAEGGPTFLEYTLVNANDNSVLESGYLQFASTDQSWDRLRCLPNGCYDIILCNPYQNVDWSKVEVFSGAGFTSLGWDLACDEGRVYHFSANAECNNIRPFCIPSFTYIQNEDGSFSFQNTSEFNGIPGVTWTFGDGENAFDFNASHFFEGSGTYEVCLYLESSLGCSESTCQFIEVLDIESISLPDLRIYPNPASDILTIEGIEKGAVIRVIDMLGKVIVLEPLLNTGFTFDVSSFSKGAYILSIASESAQFRRLVYIR